MNPFRVTHLGRLLSTYEDEGGPLDYFMSLYFRAHKAIGSKDRAFISDTAYGLVRWVGLVDYLLQKQGLPLTWQNKIQLFLDQKLDRYVDDATIPEHVRVSFPKELYERMHLNKELALALNERAPTCVRANTLKITRDDLIKQFQEAGYQVIPCVQSPAGIIFLQKINFFQLEAFKDGLFEVQDEASQCAAQLVQAKPGNEVLDFCAGSGGKALAIAEKLQGRGQIYLHDVRKSALIQAKKRLKRAGIQNAQCLHSGETGKLQLLEKRMNWVFVDAPCTGTGTLRRNPDMKWKYSDEMLQRLIETQRTIFKEALAYLSKNGRLVYATCSILPEENEQQVEYFLKHFPVEAAGVSFKSIPSRTGAQNIGPDGFFAFTFRCVT